MFLFLNYPFLKEQNYQVFFYKKTKDLCVMIYVSNLMSGINSVKAAGVGR